MDLLVQFFTKFGDKPCCITDLKIYLHLLPPDQHVQVAATPQPSCRPPAHTLKVSLCLQFINCLSEAVPLGEQGQDGLFLPQDTTTLQRHLCVCQLSRALGLHHSLDVDGKLRLIAELKAHYRHGLKFGEKLLLIFCSPVICWGSERHLFALQEAAA